MTRKKTSTFLIGLFMTMGVLIGVVTIIWLGASRYFQKGDTYVIYFDESVQGLTPDSVVKYRGVDVGRIERIRVAPDNKLVEVIMKIDLGADLTRQIVAQLKSAGLTGIVFIDLDQRQADDPDFSPSLNFIPPHPVIASRPSVTKEILAGIDLVMNKVRDLDLKGISDHLNAIGKAFEGFLKGPKTSNILANIESTTTHLDSTAQRLDKITAEGGMGEILDDTRKAVREARLMLTTLRAEVEAMKLAETAGAADQMIKDLDKQSRAIALDIKRTSENLRQASENLEALIDQLRSNPSELLFSSPPPPARD